MGIQARKLKLVEPFHIPDTFISGIGDVTEIARGLYRFTFYARHQNPYTGEIENVVVGKNVCPLEDVVPALVVCADAIGWRLSGEVESLRRFNAEH